MSRFKEECVKIAEGFVKISEEELGHLTLSKTIDAHEYEFYRDLLSQSKNFLDRVEADKC